MARMYRETRTSLLKTLNSTSERCFTISPIDADQIPNGYCKSVKVSLVPAMAGNSDVSFIVVASTSDNPLSSTDYITGQATSKGGGTVWLNLKRPVKSSAEEPNRPDGEIYVYVLCNGASIATPIECNLVAEVWGRFLLMTAN